MRDIRAERIQLALSKERLAKEAYVSVRTITLLEDYISVPHHRYVAVCKVLDRQKWLQDCENAAKLAKWNGSVQPSNSLNISDNKDGHHE